MSRSFLLISVAAAFIGAGSIAAADPAPATSTTTPAATTTTASADQAAMDEIVCKRLQVTGQLLPGPKVCRTRGQWLDMQHQQQADLQRMQDNPGTHGSK